MHSDLAKLQTRLLTCFFTENFLVKAYNFRSTYCSGKATKKYPGNELIAEAYSRRCFLRKLFKKFTANSQENTVAGYNFCKPANLQKFDSIADVFLGDFRKFSENTSEGIIL